MEDLPLRNQLTDSKKFQTKIELAQITILTCVELPNMHMIFLKAKTIFEW